HEHLAESQSNEQWSRGPSRRSSLDAQRRVQRPSICCRAVRIRLASACCPPLNASRAPRPRSRIRRASCEPRYEPVVTLLALPPDDPERHHRLHRRVELPAPESPASTRPFLLETTRRLASGPAPPVASPPRPALAP